MSSKERIIPKSEQTVLNNLNSHAHSHSSSRAKLSKIHGIWVMMSLTTLLFFIEIIVGNATNSNSLVADSFHMLSDLISYCIALVSIHISKKSSTLKNTFGWARAEILGSLVNAVFLLALCFSISIEALNRFFEPHPLKHINLILAVGSTGLFINVFGLVIFSCLGGEHLHSHGCHGHDRQVSEGIINRASSEINLELNKNAANRTVEMEHHDEINIHSHSSHNMNIRAVFLHILADALGSVAVLISALLVKFVPYDGDWKFYIDPFLSLVLTFFIVMSTVPLLKESSLILLQAVPSRVSVLKIKEEIQKLEGIVKINSLRVWSLNSDINVASVNLVVSSSVSCNDSSICGKVKRILKNNHVSVSTVQTDYETPSISSVCILNSPEMKETIINGKDLDKVLVEGENIVFDLATYQDKLS